MAILESSSHGAGDLAFGGQGGCPRGVEQAGILAPAIGTILAVRPGKAHTPMTHRIHTAVIGVVRIMFEPGAVDQYELGVERIVRSGALLFFDQYFDRKWQLQIGLLYIGISNIAVYLEPDTDLLLVVPVCVSPRSPAVVVVPFVDVPVDADPDLPAPNVVLRPTPGHLGLPGALPADFQFPEL